jgi:chemotaxis protein MotA
MALKHSSSQSNQPRAPFYGERQTDITTAAGITTAVVLVGLAIYFGSTPQAFINLPAILIVIGGTFAVTTACFTVQEVYRAQGLMLRTVFYQRLQPLDTAESMIELAKHARKHNVLALQNIIARGNLDPFLEKGLTMVIDGVACETIRNLLQQDVQSLAERHAKGVAIFRRAADIAPAMGLIGTLIGLVQMLSSLSDPASLGPAMAVALLTTLYGALLAYVVFLPLASKLDRNTGEELLVRHIEMEGVLSIARQENPRQLEMALTTLLPPNLILRTT